MRTVAHVSDLHFGTEDPDVADALLGELDGTSAAQPAVVAVSGDLTQRATAEQFIRARAFLDALPGPYIVVPGNHDIPMYDVVARFFRPLKRYRRYVTDDLLPTHLDDEIAVVGANTAHGLTIKDGKLSHGQLTAICERMSPHPTRWKLLVTHHPFVVPASREGDLIADAARALHRLEGCGIDVILAGHSHVTHMTDPAFRTADRKVICVSAGTSISTRTRGEPNGYNRLVFDGDQLTVTHRVWNGVRFTDGAVKAYRRGPGSEATFAPADPNVELAPPRNALRR